MSVAFLNRKVATGLNASNVTEASYLEGVNHLAPLPEIVLESQYLEFRTVNKVRGGRKKFHSLFGLHQEGVGAALPSYLDGQANINYRVSSRYELLQPELETHRGYAVNLVPIMGLDEVTIPPPDLSPVFRLVETSLVLRYGDVATSPSTVPPLDDDCETNGDERIKGTPGCIRTPPQPSTQIPYTLTKGPGADVSKCTERVARAAGAAGVAMSKLSNNPAAFCPQPVFPVKRNGKAPLTKNGFKDATADQLQIAAWRRQYPRCIWIPKREIPLDILPGMPIS